VFLIRIFLYFSVKDKALVSTLILVLRLMLWSVVSNMGLFGSSSYVSMASSSLFPLLRPLATSIKLQYYHLLCWRISQLVLNYLQYYNM